MQPGSMSLFGRTQVRMSAQPSPAPSRTVTSATFAGGARAPEAGRGGRRPSALCSTWSAARAARVRPWPPLCGASSHAALEAEQQERLALTVCDNVAAAV